MTQDALPQLGEEQLAEARRYDGYWPGELTGPQPCPWCGTVEPSSYLVWLNHHPGSWRAQELRMCVAMDLTRSHVHYDLSIGRDPSVSIARAREVWPAEQQGWIEEALGKAQVAPLF